MGAVRIACAPHDTLLPEAANRQLHTFFHIRIRIGLVRTVVHLREKTVLYLSAFPTFVSSRACLGKTIILSIKSGKKKEAVFAYVRYLHHDVWVASEVEHGAVPRPVVLPEVDLQKESAILFLSSSDVCPEPVLVK